MSQDTKPSNTVEIDPHTQTKILSEALPYMQRYDRQRVVIKYGGHAMGDPELSASFAKDIVMLKQSGLHPIVVHGGGPQIGAMLARLNIESEFKHGLRVTDRETVDVVEMVLAGSINKQIVSHINNQGGQSVGISGKDGNLMQARKLEKQMVDPDSKLMQAVDLGYVGEPTVVNPHIVESLIENGLIPVIAPLGVGENGQTFNINADTFAGALAVALKAKRLLLLTDVEGVLDNDKNLIEELTIAEANNLIEKDVISGGMIPKIESCISVVEQGVEAVVIMDGKVPHAVLLELFTAHGSGTLLGKSRVK
ncbi:MAG: acetylglutamate kinase [Methyloligellaceae bacterium]